MFLFAILYFYLITQKYKENVRLLFVTFILCGLSHPKVWNNFRRQKLKWLAMMTSSIKPSLLLKTIRAYWSKRHVKTMEAEPCWNQRFFSEPPQLSLEIVIYRVLPLTLLLSYFHHAKFQILLNDGSLCDQVNYFKIYIFLISRGLSHLSFYNWWLYVNIMLIDCWHD